MENNDQDLILAEYLATLRKELDIWNDDYQVATGPYFEPYFYTSKSHLEVFVVDEVLTSNPLDILPDVDDVERRYNSSHFAVVIKKARKLQEMLALENTLATRHAGLDLTAIRQGQQFNVTGITRLFQEANDLKNDDFNRLEVQEVFDPDKVMKGYETLKGYIPILENQWKFRSNKEQTKEEILEEIYKLRLGFVADCAEQIAMDVVYARRLLNASIAAKVLVQNKVLPPDHEALQFVAIYPELGADFIRKAQDTARMVGFYLSNTDNMKTDTNRKNERKIEQYVAIDPDFGLM